MTGDEHLRQVRADDRPRTPPFIMVRSDPKTDNVITAEKAGVNNSIVEPFDARTLKTRIEGVCNT